MDKFVGVHRLTEAQDQFINVQPSWLPADAQAIYGGTFVAQSLMAAGETVPQDFVPTSMHCSFLVGGKAQETITYQVLRLSEGARSAVREVRAYQEAKLIFMASLSFRLKQGLAVVSPTIHDSERLGLLSFPIPQSHETAGGGMDDQCPFICSKVEIAGSDSGDYTKRKAYQWMRSRDSTPPASNTSIQHLAALAYMSDNYFLPTTSRIRNILWPRDPELQKNGIVQRGSRSPQGHVKLMLSLDHIIYFHEFDDYRADRWVLAEMESSWAGDGRTLVIERIYTEDGRLIATALQEGLFRVQNLSGKL